MNILPAIDVFDGKAVRLLKGDYDKMTVYSEHPEEIAMDFVKCGATYIHIVDLEGAKSGLSPNFETVCKIKKTSNLFCEVGGGIRSKDVLEMYFESGIDRAILGTAAVEDEKFLKDVVQLYGDKIAVGMDLKDGKVATKGWIEKTDITADAFCEKMEKIGVKTLICTDISKDGAMQGTNTKLYEELSSKYNLQIIASGGVSSMEDVEKLAKMNVYGAIIGKAYYTGAIDLKKAIEVAK